MQLAIRDYWAPIIIFFFILLVFTARSSAVTVAPYAWSDGKSCNVYVYIYSPEYNYTYTVPANYQGLYPPHLKYLVVAGGGTGGYSYQPWGQIPGYGGGGGAGGFLYNESWNAAAGATYNIYPGLAGNNSTIYNPSYSNITAIRGGNGGVGCPDVWECGSPGLWGGSGGGGGSGGSMGGYPPWQNLSPGGDGVPGQGYKGGPAFGGYALTMSGGGGGAGSEGGVIGGGFGVVNNITFLNVTYSEGGGGAETHYTGHTGINPCKTTFGSGGLGWWDPAQDCIFGNPGIIIIQECYNFTTVYAYEGAPKRVEFRVLTHDGRELTDATVSIQGINTTAGQWDWVQTLLGIPLNEAPIQNTFMQGTTDSQGGIEFLMIPTTKYNVTTTLAGYNFSQMYIYPHDERYYIFANTPPLANTTTNLTPTPTPTPVPPQKPLSAEFESNLLLYVALGLLAFTTMFAGIGEARHVALIMCIEAWVFLSFGWFTPVVNSLGIVIVGGLFALATFVAVLWNFQEGFDQELGRL